MKQTGLIILSSLLVLSTTSQTEDAQAQEPAVATAEANAAKASAPAEAENQDETPKSAILSLPYQGIYRSVPQEKLDIATALLQ